MSKLTKQILAEHFPVYLIKVADRKEYIDDVLNGHLYMKESGYFRKLDDTYRGDRFDGRRPLDVTDVKIELRAEDGTSLILNDSQFNFVRNFHMGFAGDDKVPIYCMCLLDTTILEITGDTTFHIKKEFLEELSKFGKYAALIPLGEMYEKLKLYQQEHAEVALIYGRVEYTDILHAYSFDDEQDDNLGVYRAFFKKNHSYRFQNEWRLIIAGNEPLISAEQDHLVLDVGKFEYALALEMNDLVNGTFHIEEDEIVEEECDE